MQREEFLESVEVIFEDAFLDVIKDIASSKIEVKNLGSTFRNSVGKNRTKSKFKYNLDSGTDHTTQKS